MRRTLALGCCVLYLAFGFVAGAAHLHESADHHTHSRGLHLDHAHLGEHRHGHSHDHDAEHEGSGFDLRHVGHHDGDAIYLTAPVRRAYDASRRSVAAIAAVGATTDPPSATSNRDDVLSGEPRDPPRRRKTRPRAPPA